MSTFPENQCTIIIIIAIILKRFETLSITLISIGEKSDDLKKPNKNITNNIYWSMKIWLHIDDY